MFSILPQAWDKEKNSESPQGIAPQTFGFPHSDVLNFFTELKTYQASLLFYLH